MKLLPFAPLPATGHLISISYLQALIGVAGAVAVSLLAGVGPAVSGAIRPAVRSLRGGRAV